VPASRGLDEAVQAAKLRRPPVRRIWRV